MYYFVKISRPPFRVCRKKKTIFFAKSRRKDEQSYIIDCKHHLQILYIEDQRERWEEGMNDLNFVSKSSKLSLFGSFRSILCSTIVIILHQMCSSFANFKERQSFGCVHLTTPFSQIVFRWTFHFPSTAHGNAFKKFTILCIIYDMNVNVKNFKILLYPH